MLRQEEDEGFSLVEVVVAMFLLGLIAIAILPALINGLGYSSQQSTVATATRQVNSLVDELRLNPSCDTAALTPIFGASQGSTRTRSFTDGGGQAFTVTTTPGTCAKGAAMSLHIVATQGGRTLVVTDALVTVPPAPITIPPTP